VISSTADARLRVLWHHCGRSWSALERRVRRAPGAASKLAAMRALRSRLARERARPLRLLPRTITLAGVEDALAWLSAPPAGDVVRASLADHSLAACDTATIVARVACSWPHMPRRQMGELIHRGSASVPLLLALLDGNGTRRRRAALDPLWAVVALGELRHRDALPVLGRLLADRRPEIAAAAAEALAKIGAPALPLLARAVADGPLRRRLFAYGALGSLPGDEAFACLLAGLERAPELRDVVARALAQHGRGEAIVPLEHAAARAPRWMCREIAAAIDALRTPSCAVDPTARDWRLRYRRLPRLGWGVPLGWMTVAALVPTRRRRAARVLRAADPHALTHARATAVLDDRFCFGCGGALWWPTGVPLCRHTAPHVVALQSAMLTAWRSRGWRDVWTAIDACDRADLRIMRRAAAAPSRDAVAVAWVRGVGRMRRAEHEDARAAMARATLYWLVAVGHEDLAGAANYLAIIRRELIGLYDRTATVRRVAPRLSSTATRSPQSFS
jgi:hypothetical protein